MKFLIFIFLGLSVLTLVFNIYMGFVFKRPQIKEHNELQKIAKEVPQKTMETGALEKWKLALVMSGPKVANGLKPDLNEVDFYDLKGSLEQVLRRFSIKGVLFKASDCFIFEAGECAEILHANQSLGFVGLLNQGILNNWDIKQRNVYVAFLDLEQIYPLIGSDKRFIPIPEYPAVVRDVSLAVDKAITFDQIQTIACHNATSILSDIIFKEEYLGDKIPAGQRGLVFSLVYQSKDRTLREEEVNQVHEKILKAFINNSKAVIR